MFGGREIKLEKRQKKGLIVETEEKDTRKLRLRRKRGL